MDSQQHIFSELADCRNEISLGKKKSKLAETILSIKSVLRKEEKLFAVHSLPKLDVILHKASHHEFERALNVFMTEAEEAKSFNVSKFNELEDFIRAWIGYHEEKFDGYAESYIRLCEFAA